MREILMATQPSVTRIDTTTFYCRVEKSFKIFGSNFSPQVTVDLAETRYKKDHKWDQKVNIYSSNATSGDNGTEIVVTATPGKKDSTKKCDSHYEPGDLTVTVTNTGGLSSKLPNDVTYLESKAQLSGCLALFARFWPFSLLLGGQSTKPVLTGLGTKKFQCDADNTFTILGQNFTTVVTVALEEKGGNPKNHLWDPPEITPTLSNAVLGMANGTQITVTARPRKHDKTKCGREDDEFDTGDLTVTVTNSCGLSTTMPNNVSYFSA
jgi:hypothetical protein